MSNLRRTLVGAAVLSLLHALQLGSFGLAIHALVNPETAILPFEAALTLLMVVLAPLLWLWFSICACGWKASAAVWHRRIPPPRGQQWHFIGNSYVNIAHSFRASWPLASWRVSVAGIRLSVIPIGAFFLPWKVVTHIDVEGGMIHHESNDVRSPVITGSGTVACIADFYRTMVAQGTPCASQDRR
jgi:hypothetical protein